MKIIIFSMFFLLINQSVLAAEQRDCRFDSTPRWEYAKVQVTVSRNIDGAISGWLKQRDIIIESVINSNTSIIQKFSEWPNYYPELFLLPSFWLITDKNQKLASYWGQEPNPSYNSKVKYLPVVIRDNQGIPLKKVCRIIAKENIILEINNVTQEVKLDEIILYKKDDLIYQFEDGYLGVSSPVELEERD